MQKVKWIVSGILAVILATLVFSGHVAAQESTTAQVPYGVGKWLPSDQNFFDEWRSNLIRETDALPADTPLLPVVAEFRDLIEGDPELLMLFTEMFDQVPQKPAFRKNPAGAPQVRNYIHMLQLLNHIMTRAPEFNKTGLVGFPINAILDWPMGTPAGTLRLFEQKSKPTIKENSESVGGFSGFAGFSLCAKR